LTAHSGGTGPRLRAGSGPVMASASRSHCDGGAHGPHSRTVR
jgi:hypothetical protein